MRIRIKRAYTAVAEEDGMKILVDRLWPWGDSVWELFRYPFVFPDKGDPGMD